MQTPSRPISSQLEELMKAQAALSHKLTIALQNQSFLYDCFIDIAPRVGFTADQVNLIRAKSALTHIALHQRKSPEGNTTSGL